MNLCVTVWDYASLFEAMRKYVRLCETMQNYARLCDTMRNYAKLYGNMRNYAKLCETMRNYVESMRLYARLIFVNVIYWILINLKNMSWCSSETNLLSGAQNRHRHIYIYIYAYIIYVCCRLQTCFVKLWKCHLSDTSILTSCKSE